MRDINASHNNKKGKTILEIKGRKGQKSPEALTENEQRRLLAQEEGY
jgi:hypothetical protein